MKKGKKITMADLCTDNRFELIEKYKQMLIDATNIEEDPQEMAVIDNILFRFWQMGWLDRLDAVPVIRCKNCKYYTGKWCTRFSAKQFDINDICKSNDDFCSMAERKRGNNYETNR